VRSRLIAMIAVHSAVSQGMLSLASAFALSELYIMQAIEKSEIVIYREGN